MSRYLHTNQVLATELWAAVEANASYTQDLASKVTVAKNAAGTYFKYRPGVTVTASGDFPDIALAKSGWIIKHPILLSQPTYSTNVILYNGGVVRTAQKIALNATIARMGFVLQKYGNPSGSVYCRIRRVSDDSVIASSTTSLTIQSLSGIDWRYFAFSNVVVNEEVYLTIEYSGGDVNNRLHVYRCTSDVCSGNESDYTSSWTDVPTYDLAIKAFAPDQTETFNGSFAAGNWTFKVALYNQTKYGHAVKIAARLSRSVNADGSNATLIGQVTESPNTITLAGAAGDIKTDSWTYDPGEVTLTNEYLLVEFRCVIVTPASNSSAQHSFICDEDPATREESVTTTTFTEPGAPPAGGVLAQVI